MITYIANLIILFAITKLITINLCGNSYHKLEDVKVSMVYNSTKIGILDYSKINGIREDSSICYLCNCHILKEFKLD